MRALAAALLLFQGPALDVTVEVDRNRVAVGEEVLFTVHAVGQSTAPFRADLPGFDGFALVERRERTDVVTGVRQSTRAYTLELRLRAEQVGTWQVGPVLVEQGDASAFSPAESVTVSSATAGAAGQLDPDVLELIPRVPPPREGGPSVFTVVSDDRIFSGEQVNLLTAAWLPRGLRLRLRTPPTLSPPTLQGVWSTTRPAVSGAVASRVVNGETYDLFVGFQSAYPLNPGIVTIPPARLTWMQPTGRQVFSEERRGVAESPEVSLVVRPLPDAGRPPGFDGPVARDLQVEYRLAEGSAHAGAALRVEVAVSGTGNLPLWPAPSVGWPPDVRVYDEGNQGAPVLIGSRLGGTKRFVYSAVPDSAGSLTLPPLEYAYFDPAAAQYRIARATGIMVPVLDAAPVTEERSPLAIEEIGPPPLPERIIANPLILVPLLAAPFLAVGGFLRWRRRPVKRLAPTLKADPAAELEELVASLVPPGTPGVPRALAHALRGAGVDRESARRIVAAHLALEEQRYGRSGNGSVPLELERQIAKVLADLGKRFRRLARVAAVVLAGAGFAAAARPRALQAQSGLELYAASDYTGAARAFRREAAIAPPSAARWYDLAAAEYMSHRDAEAVAALLAARERAPRDRHVQALWRELARVHEPLRRAGALPPLNAEECLLLGLAALWVSAALFVVLRRRPVFWSAGLAVAATLFLAGIVLRQQRAEPRAVLIGGASLRLSPHGLAPERGAVPAMSIVQLVRARPDWWLIRTGDGMEGWVPAAILARSPALN